MIANTRGLEASRTWRWELIYGGDIVMNFSAGTWTESVDTDEWWVLSERITNDTERCMILEYPSLWTIRSSLGFYELHRWRCLTRCRHPSTSVAIPSRRRIPILYTRPLFRWQCPSFSCDEIALESCKLIWWLQRRESVRGMGDMTMWECKLMESKWYA